MFELQNLAGVVPWSVADFSDFPCNVHHNVHQQVRSTDFIQYAHAKFHHTFRCLLCSCFLLSSSTLVKMFRLMMMRSGFISQCAKDLSALGYCSQAILQFRRGLDFSYRLERVIASLHDRLILCMTTSQQQFESFCRPSDPWNMW